MTKKRDRLKKPIFIAGCMRSGTTLLAKLLGDHPDILHCPFELKDIWSRFGGVPMSSPKTQDRSCPSLDENDIVPGQRFKLIRAFTDQMKRVSKKKKKSMNGTFLNKNPHFCNKMPFVNALFPDARFIWIYRDLPSVVASMKKLFDDNAHYWPLKNEGDKTRCWIYHPKRELPKEIDRSRFFPGGDAKYLAEYWYENNKAVSDFLKRIPQHRYLIIREEDLIANPAKVVRQCFEFLNVKDYVPETFIKKIDSNRNSLWHERLTAMELKSLHHYVLDHEDDLDDLVPGRTLFHLYKKAILKVTGT